MDTSQIDEKVKTATFTGTVVALYAAYDLPQSNIVVAGVHAGAVTYIVDKFAPLNAIQKAIAIAGIMSVSCLWVHSLKQHTCMRYGLLTGVMAGAACIRRMKKSPSEQKQPS